MKHRWTIKELKETSDVDIIKTLINERRNELTNPYTPISSRLAKLPATVDDLVATNAELLEALRGLYYANSDDEDDYPDKQLYDIVMSASEKAKQVLSKVGGSK